MTLCFQVGSSATDRFGRSETECEVHTRPEVDILLHEINRYAKVILVARKR